MFAGRRPVDVELVHRRVSSVRPVLREEVVGRSRRAAAWSRPRRRGAGTTPRARSKQCWVAALPASMADRSSAQILAPVNAAPACVEHVVGHVVAVRPDPELRVVREVGVRRTRIGTRRRSGRRSGRRRHTRGTRSPLTANCEISHRSANWSYCTIGSPSFVVWHSPPNPGPDACCWSIGPSSEVPDLSKIWKTQVDHLDVVVGTDVADGVRRVVPQRCCRRSGAVEAACEGGHVDIAGSRWGRGYDGGNPRAAVQDRVDAVLRDGPVDHGARARGLAWRRRSARASCRSGADVSVT